MRMLSPPTKVWENDDRVFLSSVLAWALDEHRVDTLLVARRMPLGRREPLATDWPVDDITNRLFGKKVVATFLASGWPGTELITEKGAREKHVGRVYVVRFDNLVLQQMIEIEDDLLAWSSRAEPSLPEDVCVFREGAAFPLLFSVAHENEAYVAAASNPPGFRHYVPHLKGIDWCVWDGPYFCRPESPIQMRKRSSRRQPRY